MQVNHANQIAGLKKKLGITLDDTTGLLNGEQFRKESGLSSINRYRKKGLIEPVGKAFVGANLSNFYHPRQIHELKRALGITLDDTTGLLNEAEFRKETGLSRIDGYRKQGLIKPVGWALSSSQLSAYYHPQQIRKLKKKLGITLNDTTGLLNEEQFRKKSKLWEVAAYRKLRLIKPMGWALAGPKLSAFYHPRQIAQLKLKLGITLNDTSGLLSERAFKQASGLASTPTYRRLGLLKPVGRGMSASKISWYFHPQQIGKLKKALGITLNDVSGLLNERAFMKKSGLSMVARYREQGLIKPVGWAFAHSHLCAYYHPRQILQLKKQLGITLSSTKGLLNESQFRKRSGVKRVERCRERGLIESVGRAMAGSGIGYYYHPRQIKELKAKLKALKRKA